MFQAVSAMKASSILELIIRPGAGIDLFPGESSGYNSSASSVNEDHITGWINLLETKRNNDKLDNFHTKVKSIAPPRIPTSVTATIDYNSNKINNEIKNASKPNTTIIKLSDNGTVINNTLIPGLMSHDERPNCSVVRIDSNNRSEGVSDVQTVKVDVHRHGTGTISGKIPPPPPVRSMQETVQRPQIIQTESQPQPQQQNGRNSVSSTTSLESADRSSSLSSAISEAVKLRAAVTNQSLIINITKSKF